ncbi:MAG: putative transport system permease protein [Actinomycetota bacterium]|nr:putative transport system permease protein [Actinomycetota bacterium]
MIQLTLRGLMAHKRRLLSTMIAVLLGVSFMAGSRILTDTMKSSLAGVYVDSERTTDVQVRGGVAFDGTAGAIHAAVPGSAVETLRAVDGVAAVAPRIEAFAQILGTNGKPVGDLAKGAAPVGAAWAEDSGLNPFHLVAGRAPRGDAEVVIDKGTAKTGHLQVGSRTKVLTAAAPQYVTVVGIARFGDADSQAGSSSILFTADAARRYLASDGTVASIALRAEAGVTQAELARRVSAVLPPKTEAVTGHALAKENSERKNEDVSFFALFITVFAVVSLLVGGFIINNTFAIVVAQRTRELALVRALGGSRKQVRRSVALEALVVGSVSSALGLLAGVGVARGLYAMLSTFGISLPTGDLVVKPSSLLLAFAVGVLVTVASALLPARRAARVAPVAAMRDVAVEPRRPGVKRTVVGVVLTAGGAAAVIGGVLAGAVPGVLLGALASFFGVATLGPVLARPAMRVLGAWLPRARGVQGLLARENAMRNPRRTSATAAALMVGVSLVGAMTCFAASGKWSVQSSFENEFRGDIVVDSSAWQYGGFSTDLAKRLSEAPELAAVTGKRFSAVAIDGKVLDEFAGFDTQSIDQIFDIGATVGSARGVGPDGIAVEKGLAKERGWKLGQSVDVTFGSGQKRALTVRALYKHGDWVGKAFVDRSVFDSAMPAALDVQIGVKAAPGVSPAAAKAAVKSIAASYGTAKVQDRAEVGKAIVDQFNIFLGVVYGLLALAVLIALIGIANTLALSVVERTREIGVLRAVGMSRAHVRAMFRWEAALVGAFGAVLGLGVGMFLGWSLVFAISQTVETAKFVVPWGQLAIIFGVAAGCGVIAALLPARRAARLDVLDAIATA